MRSSNIRAAGSGRHCPRLDGALTLIPDYSSCHNCLVRVPGEQSATPRNDYTHSIGWWDGRPA